MKAVDMGKKLDRDKSTCLGYNSIAPAVSKGGPCWAGVNDYLYLGVTWHLSWILKSVHRPGVLSGRDLESPLTEDRCQSDSSRDTGHVSHGGNSRPLSVSEGGGC